MIIFGVVVLQKQRRNSRWVGRVLVVAGDSCNWGRGGGSRRVKEDSSRCSGEGGGRPCGESRHVGGR